MPGRLSASATVARCRTRSASGVAVEHGVEGRGASAQACGAHAGGGAQRASSSKIELSRGCPGAVAHRPRRDRPAPVSSRSAPVPPPLSGAPSGHPALLGERSCTIFSSVVLSDTRRPRADPAIGAPARLCRPGRSARALTGEAVRRINNRPCGRRGVCSCRSNRPQQEPVPLHGGVPRALFTARSWAGSAVGPREAATAVCAASGAWLRTVVVVHQLQRGARQQSAPSVEKISGWRSRGAMLHVDGGGAGGHGQRFHKMH